MIIVHPNLLLSDFNIFKIWIIILEIQNNQQVSQTTFNSLKWKK